MEDPARPTAKADWFAAEDKTLAGGQFPNLKVLSYFDHPAPPASCNWSLDTSPTSISSYATLAKDTATRASVSTTLPSVRQPGLGAVLSARTLGEFGDDPGRLATARNRKELLRTEPDHPRLGQEEHRAGPLRDKPATQRRPAHAGLRRHEQIARRTRSLRQAPRPRNTRPLLDKFSMRCLTRKATSSSVPSLRTLRHI